MSWERANPPARTGGPYQPGGLRGKTRRQFHEEFKSLLSVEASEEHATVDFFLRVGTPSSQVRTLISVNFEPDAGVADDLDITSYGSTIWLAATDPAVGGASSQDIPNSSVVGTRAAPRIFPSTITAGVAVADNGLLGFSREFVTASPYITGIATLGSGSAGGAWVLRASWQPDGVVLPDDAWAEIVALCELKAFRL